MEEAGTNEKETIMSMNLTCGPCGTVITADDEESLVAAVQAHARTHDGTELPREHILAHMRGEDPHETDATARARAAAATARHNHA